jgi:hypothetical protein
VPPPAGKGEASPKATQVKFVFACSGPFIGYQIQPQIPARSTDTEIFATDRTTKEAGGTSPPTAIRT